ncbi:hypothetical protein SAMD00079811_25870 [Scytonema sp. HK-05]|nr:hypothetical protein SAMD00079811_25870 [Scytonema sp. HK-05]
MDTHGTRDLFVLHLNENRYSQIEQEFPISISLVHKLILLALN